MESHVPKFESMKSVSEEIKLELSKFEDVNSYFIDFATKMRDDKSFEANADQITRLTRVSIPEEYSSELRSKSFMIGALFGYNSLKILENSNINQEVYNALNSLYADIRMKVKDDVELADSSINESYREYLITQEFNKRLKNELCFDAINSDEMDLVYDMITNMNASDTESYEAMRGYILVRSSLIWKENNDFKLFKDELRSVEPKKENLRQFYEIMAEVEVNTDLADGKIDCEEDVNNVVEYFEELCDSYQINKKDIDSEIEDIRDKIEAKTVERLCEQENLNFYKKFTVSGKTIALIDNGEDNEVQFMTLGEDSVIEAYIVDLEVRPIPSQRSVDKIFRSFENDKQHNMKISINPYGLVAVLDEPVLYHSDGRITVFPQKSTVYIPMNYRDLKLHRFIYDEDPDDDDDDDDEYDNRFDEE